VKPTWATSDGAVRLFLGDCLEVLPGVPIVDAVLTDTPYGIVNEFGENTGNGTRTMQFEWDSPTITLKVLDALRLAFSRCDTKAGCFVFCGGDQFGGVLEVVRESGFTAKPATWVKTCPPPAGKGNWWPSGFEFAVYGYRTGAYFGDTDPKRSNVFVCDSYRYGQPGKVDHPTQKPLRLIHRIATAIVPPRGVALDCFMGSGTTGVACVRTGRRFIGIEKEPKYFEIAVKRITDELSRAPLFEPKPQVQRELLA
jgi:site-specific DNA-methyltransferase (adenine-specific)